jgi:hypothetical protein
MPQWGYPRSGKRPPAREPGRDASDDAVMAQEDLWI